MLGSQIALTRSFFLFLMGEIRAYRRTSLISPENVFSFLWGERGSKNQREVRTREQRGKERRRGRKRERGGTGKGKEKKGKIIRFIKDHEVFRKYTEASI